MAFFKKKKEEEDELDLDLDFPEFEELKGGPKPLPKQPAMLPKPIAQPPPMPKERALPPVTPTPRPIPLRGLRIRKERRGPQDVEVGRFTPTKPYMYIKVSKYRQVLDKVKRLRHVFDELEKETRELSRVNAEVREKVSETQSVLDRIDDIIGFFEATFVRPEE